MKSVSLKGIKEFEVIEREKPKLKDGYILIDVKKSGICGSDIHYWAQGEPKGLVMGHEYAGVVYDGNNTEYKVGDRVTSLPISPCGHCYACNTGNPQYCPETWNYASGLSLDNPGGYAPKMAIRTDMIVRIPDNVKDEEAAMVEPTAVSLHAVHLANVKVGDKVLVVGGGIIGLVCAMFAKMEGASYVAISETNPSRGNKAIKLGVVDEFFDAKDSKFAESTYAKTLTGFDIVFDCCGNAPAVTSAMSVTKNGGQVILVGVSMEPITIPTVIAVLHEIQLQGAIAYTKEEFETCMNLISEKKIDVMKFVDDIVSLEEVQKSYERLTSGTDDAIKILIDPNK